MRWSLPACSLLKPGSKVEPPAAAHTVGTGFPAALRPSGAGALHSSYSCGGQKFTYRSEKLAMRACMNCSLGTGTKGLLDYFTCYNEAGKQFLAGGTFGKGETKHGKTCLEEYSTIYL